MVTLVNSSDTLIEAASGTWEVLVIGAGTAGCAAAATLLNDGYRTLIVERSAFPRAKVCGGCLAPAGADGLHQCGLGPALSRSNPRSVDRIEIVTRGFSATLPLPAYRVIDRSKLDRNLIERVQQLGGTFLDSTSATVRADDSVVLTRGTERTVLTPGAIVVADGLHGTALSHRREFDWVVEAGSHVGIGAIVDAFDGPAPDDRVRMFTSAAGYLGIAPLAGGASVLAAALDPAAVRTLGRSGLLHRMLDESGVRSEALDGIRWQGVSHLRRHRRRAAGGRVLVLGDAMRYIEPFTGEGMSWGIHCAIRMAPFVRDLLEGRPVGPSWHRSCATLLRRRHLTCRLVGATIRRPRLLKPLLRLGRTRPIGRWMSRKVCWN